MYYVYMSKEKLHRGHYYLKGVKGTTWGEGLAGDSKSLLPFTCHVTILCDV